MNYHHLSSKIVSGEKRLQKRSTVEKEDKCKLFLDKPP
jgi:hypothetical protein